MKQTNLKKYFPVLRTRVEVQTEISGNPHLDAVFKSWEKEQQKRKKGSGTITNSFNHGR